MLETKKITPRDQYLWTAKPDVQKVFTTSEVSEFLNITEATVRSIVKYHNLDFTIAKTSRARAAVYSYDTVRQIKEIHDTREKLLRASEQRRILANMETDAEQEELHPLVTDKRFLKLSYFPETVPNCFADLN
ncbi:MAG: hypothetical protein J6S85_11475 [Methanobrevibacter sp.]|nr:hypothetical protein [Methanobrevibacter sp.]